MNKQVLRDFITTRPALQELLKEALHTKETTSISLSKNTPKIKSTNIKKNLYQLMGKIAS